MIVALPVQVVKCIDINHNHPSVAYLPILSCQTEILYLNITKYALVLRVTVLDLLFIVRVGQNLYNQNLYFNETC